MFNIPEKTRQDELIDIVRKIDSKVLETIENAKVGYRATYDMLWHTPNVHPQEICDILGNEAYKMFENAMRWIQVLQQFDPSWVYPPAPYQFTVNENGTVTIGELIENPAVENTQEETV